MTVSTTQCDICGKPATIGLKASSRYDMLVFSTCGLDTDTDLCGQGCALTYVERWLGRIGSAQEKAQQ